jgi:uncharacterized damage-inducible protein DinB
MTSAELLADAFGRIREAVHNTVDGLTSEQLNYRIDPGANSIAWLIWHLTRIEDDHVAAVAGVEQEWTSRGWAERFALPLDPRDHGYGHTRDQVDAVRVDEASLLVEYHDAVHDATLRFLDTVTDADLDRIVDRSWDPPVTLGVRLVSVIADGLQHVGQAAYVRGVVLRRS